jgi:hypothetical protein
LESTSPRIINNEISLYQGELTTPVIIKAVKMISQAFPTLPKEFFDVLTERLKANGFCDERLMDSVNNVLDTFQYPTPTIAEFISYDRRTKLYTYNEALNKVSEYGRPMTEIFAMKEIDGKKYWILK